MDSESPAPAPRASARGAPGGPSAAELRITGWLHVLVGLQFGVPAGFRLEERASGALPESEYSALAPGRSAHGLLGSWEEFGHGIMPWVALGVGALLAGVGIGLLWRRRWAVAAGVRLALVAIVACVTRVVIALVPSSESGSLAAVLTSTTWALLAAAVAVTLAAPATRTRP